VEEGFDAGICLGESLRDGMTTVKIKPRLRFAVVGSTSYLERHPLSKTPDDLRGHVCIRNIYPSGKPTLGSSAALARSSNSSRLGLSRSMTMN